MDSKCLESFLIPEYEIATEGAGSTISGIAKRIFGMITGFINMIIRIFRSLINKLKGKKPQASNTQNNDQKSNTNDNTKFFKRTKSTGHAIFAMLDYTIAALDYAIGINDKQDTEKSTERINSSMSYYSEIDEYITDYKNTKCEINKKDVSALLSGIELKLKILEDEKEKLDKYINLNNIKKFDQNAVNRIARYIPKAQNYAIQYTNIVNNCVITEG